MKNRTEELLENQKYLDDLLNKVWKNDFSKCEEMSDLIASIACDDLDDIANNIKKFVLAGFKLGYHYGFRDGEKPQRDERHNKLMKNSDKTLAIMEELANKMNIKLD